MGSFRQKSSHPNHNFIFISRQKLAFIFGFALFTLYITYMFYSTDFFQIRNIRQRYNNLASQIGFGGSAFEQENHDEDANMTCKLPKLIPFDPSITDFVKETSKKIVCNNGKYPPLFRKDNDSNLRMTKSPFQFGLTDCCYKNVSRIDDETIRSSNTCYPLTNVSTKIPAEHDVIAIYCRNTSNLNDTRAAIDVLEFPRLNVEAEKRIESLPQNELNPDNFSVILFGMDSTSHMNFLRVMPKTHKYITEELSGVGMNGFVSVGSNTFPNVVAALTGLDEKEFADACWPKDQHFDCCPFIWKDFSKQGFRTYYAEDIPSMTAFAYMKSGFLSPPTDYFPQHFLQSLYDETGHMQPVVARLCAGSRLGLEILLDQMKEFAVLMGPRKYFQFIWCNTISHDDQMTAGLGDEPFYSTMKTMKDEGYLENKILIFFSDHGIRWGQFRTTYQGQIEVRMPHLYVAIPKAFQIKYPSALQNLRSNANRLASSFDIYGTLAHILRSGKQTSTEGELQYKWVQKTDDKENIFWTRSKSLFEPIPLNRSCENAGIPSHFCVCYKPTQIPTNQISIQEAGQVFVSKLNEKLKGFRQCAFLKLGNISEAVDLLMKNDLIETVKARETNTTVTLVRLVLETVPGNAKFETTMSGSSEHTWQVLSDSRINMYKSQSHCINDAKLKNYCYCLEQ